MNMKWLLLLLIAIVNYSSVDCRLGGCEQPPPKIDDHAKWLEDNCDSSGYAIGIGIQTAPAAVLAILFACACPVFLCGRLCCNCFGGKNPTEGCCCPDNDSTRNYTKLQVIIVKVMAIVALVIMVLGLIIGVSGVTKLNDGILGGFEGVDEVLEGFQKIGIDVKNTLVKFNGLFNQVADRINDDSFRSIMDTENFDKFIDAIETVRDDIDEDEEEFSSFKTSIVNSAILFFCLPLVCVCVGTVTGLFNIRRIIHYLCFAGITMLAALIWIFLIFINIFHLVITDICVEVDDAVDPATTNTSIIKVMLDSVCDEEKMSTARNETVNAEEEAAEKMCELLRGNNMCGHPSRPLDCSAVPTTCTSARQIKQLPDQIGFRNDAQLTYQLIGSCTPPSPPTTGLYCSMRECSTQCQACSVSTPVCVGPTMQDYTWSAIVLTDIAVEAFDLLDKTIRPKLNCAALLTDTIGPFQSPCHDVRDGFGLAKAGIILALVGMFLGLITSVLGTKRYLSFSDLENNKIQVGTRSPQRVADKADKGEDV